MASVGTWSHSGDFSSECENTGSWPGTMALDQRSQVHNSLNHRSLDHTSLDHMSLVVGSPSADLCGVFYHTLFMFPMIT